MVSKVIPATGHARNTVRRRLREADPPTSAAAHRRSTLDPYKEHITSRFMGCDPSAFRLLDEIRPMGCEGSVDGVRRFVRGLRRASVAAQKATVRFEAPPGQQGKVDWAYCGHFSGAIGIAVGGALGGGPGAGVVGGIIGAAVGGGIQSGMKAGRKVIKIDEEIGEIGEGGGPEVPPGEIDQIINTWGGRLVRAFIDGGAGESGDVGAGLVLDAAEVAAL